MKVSFPCQWPGRLPRSVERESGRFSVDYSRIVADLTRECGLFGVEEAVLTVNYAEQKHSPEAALWFTWGGTERVLACDRYTAREANVRAIGLTLEAMRGIERWGTGLMLEQAMQGFDALPPPSGGAIVSVRREWFEVLGVLPNAPIESCEAVYRILAKAAHPDAGGSTERMAELNRAIEEARNR